MCIMQRTTKKIYLRLKSGAECIWLSHSAASSFTGSPGTSTGMPRKSKVKLAVLLIDGAFRLGTHVPPQRMHSAQGDLGEPAHGVCTQGSLYKSQGSTLKASTNRYVPRVWKPLKKGGRPGVGSRGRGEDSSRNLQPNNKHELVATWKPKNLEFLALPPFICKLWGSFKLSAEIVGEKNV